MYYMIIDRKDVKTMRNKLTMTLLHNLGMILFIILIAYNRSSVNQIILSIIAVVYWVLGYVIIYKKMR